MTTTISLAELRARGGAFSPQEAVAIAQSLIHDEPAADEVCPPYGAPNLENITIGPDGAVRCRACAATPGVYETAVLLQSLLDGAPRVPGGLQYAIGRALLEVEAPPFDSLEEFSRALERFEQSERRAVLRALYARRSTEEPATVAAHECPVRLSEERRRHTPSATELRRQLRDADRELFEERFGTAALGPTHDSGGARLRRAPIAAGLAAGVALIVVGGLMHHRAAQLGTIGAPPAVAITTAAPPAVPAPPEPDASPAARAASAQSPTRPPLEGALVQAVDGHQRPVFSPAFASNGTAMFFHTGRTGDARSAVASLDRASDDLRVMTIVDDGSRNYHVQPSPDGQSIAFDSDRDGERGVYVASRDGTGVHRVSGDGYAAVPTWSPDARQLAFIRAEADNSRVWNLWLLTVATGEARRLTAFNYGQTWSASWFPDGRQICYSHEDRLIVQDLETGQTKEYPSPVPGRLVRTPAVSPDGSKVMFQVYRSGAWLLDLHDGSVRCVLTDPTAEEFAWAPDGRRVAFHSRRDGQWGIWMMSGI